MLVYYYIDIGKIINSSMQNGVGEKKIGIELCIFKVVFDFFFDYIFE